MEEKKENWRDKLFDVFDMDGSKPPELQYKNINHRFHDMYPDRNPKLSLKARLKKDPNDVIALDATAAHAYYTRICAESFEKWAKAHDKEAKAYLEREAAKKLRDETKKKAEEANGVSPKGRKPKKKTEDEEAPKHKKRHDSDEEEDEEDDESEEEEKIKKKKKKTVLSETDDESDEEESEDEKEAKLKRKEKTLKKELQLKLKKKEMLKKLLKEQQASSSEEEDSEEESDDEEEELMSVVKKKTKRPDTPPPPKKKLPVPVAAVAKKPVTAPPAAAAAAATAPAAKKQKLANGDEAKTVAPVIGKSGEITNGQDILAASLDKKNSTAISTAVRLLEDTSEAIRKYMAEQSKKKDETYSEMTQCIEFLKESQAKTDRRYEEQHERQQGLYQSLLEMLKKQ